MHKHGSPLPERESEKARVKERKGERKSERERVKERKGERKSERERVKERKGERKRWVWGVLMTSKGSGSFRVSLDFNIGLAAGAVAHAV